MGSQSPRDENDPEPGGHGATPADDSAPTLPPEWAALVIPDDASALAAEAVGIRAELAAERRRRPGVRRPTLRREVDGRRHTGWRYATEYGDAIDQHRGGASPGFGRSARARRHPMTKPVLLLALLVLASTASLFAAVLPTTSSSTRLAAPRPLGPPAAPVGQVGGLLPDLTLTGVGGTAVLGLRAVRPAVVLLLPDGCRCAGVTRTYLTATARPPTRIVLVGHLRRPPIPADAISARVHSGMDPANTLAASLRRLPTADRPTAVLVRADGTIARVIPSADTAVPDRASLDQLVA